MDEPTRKRMDRRMDEPIDKPKKSALKKILLTLLVIILLAVIAVAGYGYYTLNRISSKDVAAKKVEISKPVNILLLGVDAGDYDNKSKNDPKRSDTMMLVRYNPKTGRVYILSIPRDTKARLKGHVEKLNAAHALGGIPYTIESIENLLGVDINYYAELNYEGFRECIDAIGGVDIKIPRDMDYDAWKISVHFKKGEIVHMDGEKAEEFVRWRKNNDGGGYAMGDLGRINTQQEFIVKIIEKMKTPSGMVRIPSLINTVSKYLKTNMGTTTMLRYALKARGIKTDLIERQTLSGQAKYINGVSYYIWDKDVNNKFLANFKGHETEQSSVVQNTLDPGKTEPETSVNANTDDRTKIDVVILNSTGKAGLASQYKDKLEKLGYKVTQTGNYSYRKYSSTLINDYSKNGYGNLLLQDLNLGNVVIKHKDKPLGTLVVILGKDSIK